MKTNYEKQREVCGIDHHGYTKDAQDHQVRSLMTWAMMKGFWQGFIGGMLLVLIGLMIFL